MVTRPPHVNAYEFVVVSALRAQQLLAGCTPRLEGDHSAATMAQMEVAAGCVGRARDEGSAPSPQSRWQL
jgi:DNA-directed RNA polymerase subunit K/omega